MRVILDTDKKTITLPWNYREKLEAYNKMVMDISGDESKKKNFKSFVDDVWKECMPDIPGLAVWHDGHIGVYIGGGQVIEAMGTKYGVVKTELAGRGWTHWLKIPYINYD